MNADRIKGKAKQIQGKLIDAKGDITGNPAEDLRGKYKKIEGELQESWGKAKDAMKKPRR
jgi:uncharacterized protein YjbJ (UPF0337 family)